MRAPCICYATTLTFLLKYSSATTLSRIIGGPFHSPPWSNEEELNINLKQMEAKRAAEREKFKRKYEKEWKEYEAMTVTESPEKPEPDISEPDTEEINRQIAQRPYLAKIVGQKNEQEEPEHKADLEGGLSWWHKNRPNEDLSWWHKNRPNEDLSSWHKNNPNENLSWGHKKHPNEDLSWRHMNHPNEDLSRRHKKHPNEDLSWRHMDHPNEDLSLGHKSHLNEDLSLGHKNHPNEDLSWRHMDHPNEDLSLGPKSPSIEYLPWRHKINFTGHQSWSNKTNLTGDQSWIHKINLTELQSWRHKINLTKDLSWGNDFNSFEFFQKTFTFKTTSTTTKPTTSFKSTLVFTLRYGFVFEEIVGLISTTPTPRRFPRPRSTEIFPFELWPEGHLFSRDSDMKRLWQINRYTPFLVHFTDPAYSELTTLPRSMEFNVSWQYSDDPCDLKIPFEERNHTTTEITYDSGYIVGDNKNF